MTTEMPPFWWNERDWRAWLFFPFAAAYGFVAGRRMDSANPPKGSIPVLCIGNLTVGGTGKTPVAIAIARRAKRSGLKPGFLTRGYGGSSSRPHLVDQQVQDSRHSGDEPLLLAQHAPVAVAANRAAGLELLVENGCNFAIMDDGFQSRRLHYDYALVVVDGHRGIGNGHVLPAGPLRAPVATQLRHADAILRLDEGRHAVPVIRRAARAALPVHIATTRILNPEDFTGKRFVAFAGIGNPAKFFDTLAGTGAEIVARREFHDHYPYRDEDIHSLEAEARHHGAELVTTAKDAIRLAHGTRLAREFHARLKVLHIEIDFRPESVTDMVIRNTVTNFRRRVFG